MKILKKRFLRNAFPLLILPATSANPYPLELHTVRDFLCQNSSFFALIRQNKYKLQKVPVTYGFCLFPLELHRLPALFAPSEMVGSLCNANGKRQHPQVTGTFSIPYPLELHTIRNLQEKSECSQKLNTKSPLESPVAGNL